MHQEIKAVALVLMAIMLSSCTSNKASEPQKTKSVSWSHHKGEIGPENWANLCDTFSKCGGKAQSPINLVTKKIAVDDSLTAPTFSYGESKVDIINNSHTVQFNISGKNQVNLDGKEYTLLQFHYHALSEHTIDGKYFPLEVHFVHKHSDTDFAVLGVMFEEGEKNELLDKYLADFPTSKGEFKSDADIDLLSLLPKDKSYYNSQGSLTTPPCSEVVNWYVLKTPVTASKEQLKQFSKILNNNYRPIMPLNDRAVRAYSE